MDAINISLIVVMCAIFSLGFIVLYSGREKINRLYSINILTILFWGVSMICFRSSTEQTILLWTKILYVSASLIASNFLYFTYVFPKYKYVKTRIKLCIFLPNLILIYLVLFTNLIVYGAKINISGENYISWGHVYILYVLYILVYFNFAFYRLFIKFRSSKDKTERSQLIFVLVGYGSSGVISFVSNLILPSFNIFVINWVGQISTILMALSATYAIIKHRLFSIRIIATELLIFLLWIVLLVRLLLGQTLSDHIVNSVSFILTIVAGVFLIRSVIKEISQREKIEHLASDLETSNKHLVDLNKQKSEFVSFATHQLRAPLTAMKGYASLLLEGDMGKLEPESREGVNRIFEASKSLTNIVEDYLNLTRIELGSMKYAFDATDLRLLIENVIAELKPTIDEKKDVKFTYDYENIGSTYRITADKEKLKQVISNIIDNALKYTPKGKVSVHLSFDRSKHRFVLTVEDTGIGISQDILPRLFMKFSRADNANMTNIKGTGLGLYVAKEIMTAHGGTIEAESGGEGKGSKFIIEFEPLVTA